MILEQTPITLAEVQDIVKDMEENQEIKDYLKKFTKLKKEKALELAEKIKGLDNMKVRDAHVVKIVDFLPKDAEDLNKIFTDASLSEDEIQAILAITKEY